MAITRAQQAKQMLQDGGMLVKPSTDGKRPGYRNPNEDRAKEEADRKASANRVAAATNVASMQRALGTKDSRTPQQQAARDRLRDQREGTQETLREQRDDAVRGEGPFTLEDEDLTIRERIQRGATKFGPFSFLQKLGTSKLARLNNALQRQNYIDSLDLTNPKDKEEYDRIMNELGGLGMGIIAGPGDLKDTRLTVPPSMLATDPMTQFKTVDGVSALGDPDVKDVLGTGYEEYLDRFNTESTGGDDTPMDPCLGPNPPAYCFIGDKADETQEAVVTRNLAGLTPRIGGSIFNFDNMADGGIAGMDREAFLLGGIAKGLKKATRAVKKIAKSPIGKAALLYFGGQALMSGGAGGGLKSFFGKGSFSPFKTFLADGADVGFGPSGLGSILINAVLVNKAGSLTALGLIGVPTVASLFMTPK